MKLDDSLNVAFWIGLAIAIPLSIAGNLLTPYFQSLWEARSEKSRSAQQAKLQKEYELLKRYASHKDEYNDYQFSVIIKTTIINALAGGLAALLSTFGSASLVMPWSLSIATDRFANTFFAAANLFAALAALITMNIAREAWRYHKALRDLDAYANRNGLQR